MTRPMLQRLALFARHRYRLVFVVFALVLAGALLLASRLRFDADVLNLLPRKDPVITTYLETLEEFGTFDYLMVTVEIPEGRVTDPYLEYADILAGKLQALPEVESVDYQVGELEELLAEFFPKAVMFLDQEGREAFAERLTDEGIQRRVRELRRLVTTPTGQFAKELLALDPLGLAQVFIERLSSGRGAMAVDWTSGYFLSRDHRLLLLLAKPVRPPQDVEFDRQLDAAVSDTVAAALEEWRQQVDGDVPPPRVAAGGPHITALEDATLIQSDMMVNMATSMGLVLLLFLVAFRRFGPLSYAFLPLAAGLILAFGFSAATYGVVSSATSGTAALLIGLGIDFVIVSYGRFVEERRRGATLEQGMATMMGSSGRAVVIGAVTTAATFYAFTFTDFRGLRQMGVLTGTGILFCMISVLLLLPAMLAWSEDHHRRRESRPNLYLHSFGTGRVVRFCLTHSRPVLLAGVVVSLGAALLLPSLGFQDNWRAMRPEGSRGMAVERAVSRHFDSDFDYMMLVVSGTDLPSLIERTDEVARRAQQLVDDGVINGVESITSVIPPRARQQQALDWLAAGRASGRLDMQRIRATFAAAAAEEGLRAAAFDHGLDLLAEALSPTELLAVDDFPSTGQARRLLDRVLLERGGVWKSVVYLYPPAEVWRRQPPPQAVALANALGDDVVLTGANVVNQNMRVRVRRDAWIAAALGTLLVALLLWLDFRSLRAALLALTPLAVGIVWMLGAMSALGIDMNFMNIFVTTMIIGIGVDYGLHMVHRYREVRVAEREGTASTPLARSLEETGNAIVVAALSTIAGFGSLSLSHFPGLRSTGIVAILGASATAVVAITQLPAYLGLRVARRQAEVGEKPEAEAQ